MDGGQVTLAAKRASSWTCKGLEALVNRFGAKPRCDGACATHHTLPACSSTLRVASVGELVRPAFI